MKYHWHPVVYRLPQFIGVCSDDRIGLQRLPCGLVLPCVPQASEREEFSVFHGDGVRLLGLRIEFLSFVKPIGGYEAAPTLHGFSIRRTGGDGLCFLGVNRVERHLGVLRPERHETPTHDGQLSSTCLRIKSQHGLKALGSDIIIWGEIGVIKNVSIVGLHPLRDALLISPSAVCKRWRPFNLRYP